MAGSKIEEEIFTCTGVVLWASVLHVLTETKLTKDAIIYSIKVRLSVFILVTGTAITVDSRGGGDTATFQGAFTVTGNLEVTYVPDVISVGNPDYLELGHYAINKDTFITRPASWSSGQGF